MSFRCLLLLFAFINPAFALAQSSPPWSCPLPANSPAGTLDSCFMWFNRPPNAARISGELFIRSDGKFYANVWGQQLNGLPLREGPYYRLNADGTLDTTFHMVTPPSYHYWHRMLKMSDDRILLLLGDMNIPDIERVVKLTDNGNIDTTFHWALNSTGDKIDGMLSQSDNKFITWNSYGYAKRYNADGSLDTTFHLDAIFSSSMFNLIQDSLYCTTQDYQAGRVRIVEFKSNGTLKRIVLDKYISNNSSISSLTFQNDGKFLVTETLFYTGGSESIEFYRLLTNGRIDSTFMLDTAFFDPHNRDFRAYFSNPVMLTGNKFLLSYGDKIGIFNSDGSLDTATHFAKLTREFGDTIYNYPTHFTLCNNGEVFMGGNFTHYGNYALKGLAKLFFSENLITEAKPIQNKPIFTLQPNPATRTITLTSTQTGPVTFYNAQGKAVLSAQKRTLAAVTFSIAELPSGLYSVRLGTGQARLVKE